MLAAAPVRASRIDAAGASTATLVAGAGPPLVLLHGGIECGGAYWAPVIEGLSRTHRVIVPDVPGLGESEPLASLDAVSFARWLDAVLDLTCDRAPIVVAHSLLGTLAARHAAGAGGRLRRLVIYAAPGVGAYRMPLRLRIVATRFALRPTQRNEERFERFALLDLDRLRRRDRAWFEAFDAYTLARARERHVKRTMGRLIKLGTARVSDDDLRRIDRPVSLLWGREDRMVPLALAEGARNRLGWHLDVIDGAAHVPHLERPEEFVTCLNAPSRVSPRLPSLA
jgi:pimeloyl-ACP methyl ester carboxylesterase